MSGLAPSAERLGQAASPSFRASSAGFAIDEAGAGNGPLCLASGDSPVLDGNLRELARTRDVRPSDSYVTVVPSGVHCVDRARKAEVE